ncbi:PREDICTED: alpha-tectorin-like [Nanorana parkeri]|uniref:alpha-tectorin-like n=1 Tax=Nanorana parkeri TaxID=125878 RepID=UPI0008544ED5|nr:PREDICTED: alpha-tectorin-like [Nanorana parkeri]
MKALFGLTLLLLGLPSILMLCMEEGSNLFPYGLHLNDVTTPREDDGASERINFLHSFTMFHETHRSCYVNNNGAISFKKEVTSYTPDGFPLANVNVICPFWGDVDNEEPDHGDIFHRQVLDEATLDCISSFVRKYFPNFNFTASWAFIATWDKVHYHGSESDKTNTFQCVLASDKYQRSVVIFLYENISWTTGTASGGDPMTGLGGIPAQAGFNTENEYFNMPMSRTEHIVNIASSSNVERPGLWMFRVDEFIVPGGCVYKDSFMSRGQTAWMDDGCSEKCFCKHDGRVECARKVCDEGLVCLASGRFFACQINEEDC